MKIDKLKHAGIGFILGIATIVVQNPILASIIALFSIVLFVVKEIYDKNKTKPTGFSVSDILADLLGFGFGLTVATWLLGVIK